MNILRAALADGVHFRWGDRLIERDVCELLGTSRTTVREALRQLETEGLVKMVPGKGPVVAGVTPEEARALYEVRASLEGLAGRLFVENASSDELDALVAAFERFVEASDTRLVSKMIEAKDEFYGILFRGSGNEVLQGVMSTIYTRVRQLRFASLSEPKRSGAAAAELREALDAIRTGNAAEAERLFALHVQRAAVIAVEAVRRTVIDNSG